MLSTNLEKTLHRALADANERRHEYATLEHLLLAMIEDGDAVAVLRACSVDLERLRAEIIHYIDTELAGLLATHYGEAKPTAGFQRVLQRAAIHVQSSGREEVTGANVLVAIFNERESHAAFFLQEQDMTRYDAVNYLSHGVAKDPAFGETRPVRGAEDPEPAEKTRGDDGKAEETSLGKFCVDLNAKARAGRIDPLIGRDPEVERCIQVLCRRRKNNPVFVGDAGVGKTALVEGLAQRLIGADLPDLLEGAEIYALDTGALLAGTRYRGEFEERFKALIDALGRRPKPILFIDELHTMIGAGATSGGTMDLANLIKPVLAGGGIRMIGSTTFDEFKQLEKDRALHRRLQKIIVDEPSVKETVKILNGLKKRYEEHHDAVYTEAALLTAVRLAQRHLRDYKLPDSAVDVIDEAGSMVRLRERGDGPRTVEDADIEKIIARMARIPEKQATVSEKERLRTLAESLKRVVFGQAEAVDLVAKAIRRARAGLGHPEHPAGCFLFTGPTGVGKTALAKQLARHLGNEFTRFDMSEYQEKHAVARLIGAPPGYVGYEEGGYLTERVRRRPYSLILLDEIEKAHPDVFNIFLQILDDGRLTDGQGRTVDFRNTVLIMTSNIGSQHIVDLGADQETEMRSRVMEALRGHFKPEFLNRIDDVVIFHALREEQIAHILEILIGHLQERLADRRIRIEVSDDAKKFLAARGYDPQYGARPLKRLLQRQVQDPLAMRILEGDFPEGSLILAELAEGGERLEFSVAPATEQESG